MWPKLGHLKAAWLQLIGGGRSRGLDWCGRGCGRSLFQGRSGGYGRVM